MMGAGALPPNLGMAVQLIALQRNWLTGMVSPLAGSLLTGVSRNLASGWAQHCSGGPGQFRGWLQTLL